MEAIKKSKPSSTHSNKSDGAKPFLGIQAKLNAASDSVVVNKPGDKYEVEADHAAEQVVSKQSTPTPAYVPSTSPVQLKQENDEPVVQEKPIVSSITPFVQAKEEESAQMKEVQAKEMSPSNQSIKDQLKSSKGEGSSLSGNVRKKMETGFGTDFSDVKIHTNSSAVKMNEEMNAQAFTHGKDIYFNRAKYNPGTPSGDFLLAHELTHTIQQGNSSASIQRSMKFELQTNNYVVATSNDGERRTKLPRKFGASSTSFDESSANEKGGNQPTYIATGAHGGKAQSKGVRYVPLDGPSYMKADLKADVSKKAQFEYTYLVKGDIQLDAVPKKEQLFFIGEINNALLPNAQGTFNSNTVLYRYVNENNKLLDIHIDENGLFKSGQDPMMRVAKKDEWSENVNNVQVNYNTNWPAEFLIEYQFNKAVKENEIIGKPISAGDYSEKSKKSNITEEIRKSGNFNKGTYKLVYFNQDGSELLIHASADNTYKKGTKKLMRSESVSANEQTAIELQVEHGSFIEFETPKWFKDWDELKLRIEDAVTMTKEISDPSRKITDKRILNGFKVSEGIAFDWPYPSTHLPLLKNNNLKLIALVFDPMWFAKIQTSDSILLSEYEQLMEDRNTGMMKGDLFVQNYQNYLTANPGKNTEAVTHAHTVMATHDAEIMKSIQPIVANRVNIVKLPAKRLFDKFYTSSKKLNKPTDPILTELYKSRFSNLLGFIELVMDYIYQGQTQEMYAADPEEANSTLDKPIYSKAAFFFMSRSDFSSIFQNQLNADEKTLYQEIVSDATNPLLKEIEPDINTTRANTKATRVLGRTELENALKNELDVTKKTYLTNKLKRKYWDVSRWESITLDGNSNLFFNPVGSSKIVGPKIVTWLTSMSAIDGADLMTPAKTPGLSASHGVKKVSNDPKNKDYKKAQFEFRGGPSLPASEWVSFVESAFDSSRKRDGDTPDDKSTQVNEATTKTKLNK
jgi:hypothetical protein